MLEKEAESEEISGLRSAHFEEEDKGSEGRRAGKLAEQCQKSRCVFARACYSLSSLINMHRRSRLSDDLRECIVKIHKHGIRVKQISEWTGISERTLYEVIQKYNHKGTVSTEALRNRGRPRALDYVDTEVSRHSQSTCTLLYLLYSSCSAHWGTEMTYIWMN